MNQAAAEFQQRTGHPRTPCGHALVLVALMGACGGNSPTAPTEPLAPTPTPRPDLGPPNIVLILADDMGWGDVGMNGGSIPTPHIDRLAREGARFTDFYTTAPVCAPSRAGIMTGQWPPHAGIPWNPPKRLNGDEVVIAEPLRAAGYATAILGKWHLGWEAPDMPIHWGFDYFYGVANGDGSKQGGFILGDRPTDDAVGPTEMADRYADYALRFIEERGEPFFVYVSHRDPHLPNYSSYEEAVRRLDRSTGKILEGLEALGVAENTLVFFTSDNGPAKDAGSAGPFTDGKGSCAEGGIRMPAAARWPARIPAGSIVREIASTLDLFPTFVALAQGEMPERFYPGQDITPLLTGAADRLLGAGVDGGREMVCWQQGGQLGGIRSGRWKFLFPGVWNAAPTLVDLESDPGETRNLATTQPELAEELERRVLELTRR